MPNEYSVEIHNYLKVKIEIAEKTITESVEHKAFLAGQLQELLWIREYLKDHIDLKNFTYY